MYSWKKPWQTVGWKLIVLQWLFQALSYPISPFLLSMTQLPLSAQRKKHAAWFTPSGIISLTVFGYFPSWLTCLRKSFGVVFAKPFYCNLTSNDNTRKQPAEAYLGNRRTISGVSFSHPELQNMPSYPLCYQTAYNTYWFRTLWARGTGRVSA